MFERYGSFIVAPVCKNWSRLRLNANSTQNVSKWEDIGHITMVSISCNHMSYHTTKLFQKDIDVLGKMCVAKLSEYELEMLEQDWKNGASCDRSISCFVQFLKTQHGCST